MLAAFTAPLKEMPDKRSAFSGNSFKLQPFQMASGSGDTESADRLYDEVGGRQVALLHRHRLEQIHAEVRVAEHCVLELAVRVQRNRHQVQRDDVGEAAAERHVELVSSDRPQQIEVERAILVRQQQLLAVGHQLDRRAVAALVREVEVADVGDVGRLDVAGRTKPSSISAMSDSETAQPVPPACAQEQSEKLSRMWLRTHTPIILPTKRKTSSSVALLHEAVRVLQVGRFDEELEPVDGPRRRARTVSRGRARRCR